TFCTGGIRCEKAAPYLESRGFSNVYQLEGGILKYLEECGGAHYRGQCFVFDKRVSLDANLSAGDLRQCFVCQAVLSPEEQASPLYVEGESCPHCHCSEEESLRRHLGRRQQALQRVCLPLPGSVPYDNVRPISVPQRLDGVELLDFLDAMRTQLSREDWRQVCRQGRLVCRGQQVLPGRVVRAGERLLHTMPATREPDVNGAIQILHEDDAIVVVNPPAPLPAHPCGRFNRNSLTYLLGLAYHPLRLRPAHRLDADTTGVMVFSKTGQIARIVQPQFDAGLVGKTYLARVHGRPAGDVFECQAALSAAPAADGVRLPDENGAAAHTRFEVLRALSDSTTLLKAYPLTGRTNQIRAHLWLLDLPIVGDPIYLPGRQLGSTRSLSLRDPPLCLHAAAVEFTHPLNGQRQQYAAAAPAWASNQG
ncbi:MAG: pseudouridine synthase, partial [Pirellulales bacterium]